MVDCDNERAFEVVEVDDEEANSAFHFQPSSFPHLDAQQDAAVMHIGSLPVGGAHGAPEALTSLPAMVA